MVMSFAAMGLVSVLWVLFGYSLAFSPGEGVLAPFIGGLQWAGLSNRSAPYGDGELSQGIMHNHSSYLGTGGLRAFRL
jgi:ammonia channel protein AmtB